MSRIRKLSIRSLARKAREQDYCSLLSLIFKSANIHANDLSARELRLIDNKAARHRHVKLYENGNSCGVHYV